MKYNYSIGVKSTLNDCGALDMVAIARADER